MAELTATWTVRRLLEWKPIQAVGIISYSLYLTHYPVLAALYSWLHSWQLSPNAEVGIMIVVGVPLSLVVAYFFYTFLERPFLSGFAALKPRSMQNPVPLAE